MSPFGTITSKILGATAGMMLMATGGAVQAVVILPGPAGQPDISFADNAFADTLLSSTGSFFTDPDGTPLEVVLTDTSVTTSALSLEPGASVTLGFTDNLPIDGAGADIAIYDRGTPPGNFVITIGSTTLALGSVSTGQTAGTDPVSGDPLNLNVLLIDLASFGVASASSLVIDLPLSAVNGVLATADLALVAAINNFGTPTIPVPGVLTLMVAGLAGIGFHRRGRQLAL